MNPLGWDVQQNAWEEVILFKQIYWLGHPDFLSFSLSNIFYTGLNYLKTIEFDFGTIITDWKPGMEYDHNRVSIPANIG